ncbi:putative udp-glc gal endoplasmic reticulum nucleotide sugar transporter [Rosellinia necatrix]|uniref:Putative udp-glc gal endoplasmic reticulum nucleotide sugar transporter n=1 Tax=Rosellinia necatrix TaxID=77044 RepID=A0A1W2TW77_ROSNE|nr:putative udp-glc gal endoplasmic reticulum nucleotide sugar transporter [Rosellinia necatrix]
MRFLAFLRGPPTGYHGLRLSEEKASTENEEYSEEQSKRPAFSTIIVTIIIIALAVSLVTVSVLYVQLLRQLAPRPLLTCGKSVEEAQRAGCSFDRLTKTWLPAACPRDYEEEFVRYPTQLNITEWKYWTDLSTTEEITDDSMAVFAETKSRNAPSWVSTLRMHIAHCAFGLKRRSDSLDAGGRLDLATSPLDHTHHCLDMLLEAAMRAPGIDVPLAQGKVIFGAC